MDINTGFTDEALEHEGSWVDYKDGAKVKVARLGNPRFQRFYNAQMKPHRRREREGSLDPETQNTVLVNCLAETILLGWDGFTDKGKEFPYNKDNARALLHKSMDFRNDVVEMADNAENFKAELIEDGVKNS